MCVVEVRSGSRASFPIFTELTRNLLTIAHSRCSVVQVSDPALIRVFDLLLGHNLQAGLLMNLGNSCVTTDTNHGIIRGIEPV